MRNSAAKHATRTRRDALEERYAWGLRAYIVRPGESTLRNAREAARMAAARGLGSREVAALHHAALSTLLGQQKSRKAGDIAHLLETAARFLGCALQELETEPAAGAELATALRLRVERQEGRAQRIAHTLLDEVAQPMIYVHLVLSELAAALPDHAAKLARAQELLYWAETQLGRMSYELHPTVLDDLGLGPAIQSLATLASAASALPIFVDSSMEGRLAPSIETAIYRAVEEMLCCAEMPAGVRAVTIGVQRSLGSVHCSLCFQGLQSVTGRLAPTCWTRSLAAMQDRIESAGGRVTVVSDLREGTSLLLAVPVDACALELPPSDVA